MKFGIVVGSHRPRSESLKVGRYIEGAITRKFADASVYLLGLGGNPLPLWDEGRWNDDPQWERVWGPISRELQTCEAFAIVSPEWSGMVPAGLKNFFLLCGAKELSHKPGLIVTVSASRGGAYPVAELRMSSYKNTQFCYIPEHVIVRDAGDMLNGSEPSGKDDIYLRARLDHALGILHEYGRALRLVRESGVVDYKTYPFGM